MPWQEVVQRFGLVPLEGEGGYFRIAHAFMQDGKKLGGVIWYLITPDSFSSLHWLPTDEVWYHLEGDPVSQLVLRPDGTFSETLLHSGASAMSVVEGGCWQGTRLTEGWSQGYALCSTVMCPAYVHETYRQGTSGLLSSYPDCNSLASYLSEVL